MCFQLLQTCFSPVLLVVQFDWVRISAMGTSCPEFSVLFGGEKGHFQDMIILIPK